MRRESLTHKLIVNLVSALMVLSLAGLLLAGCGSSSWTNISLKSPKGSGGAAFACDPAHDILYVGGFGGVSRCANPDTNPTWTRMVGGVKLEFVDALVYDATHDVLYAGASGGVYSCASPASSASWKTTNGVGANHSLAYDSRDNTLYAGTSAGVYRCTNPESSPSWANTGGGVDGSTVSGLIYDPGHHVIYAGTDSQGIGVWRYQGGTWTNTDKDYATSKTIGSAGGLAYDPTHNILYATSENFYDTDNTTSRKGVLRCTKPDTDPTWTSVAGRLKSYTVGSLAYDPASNILYAGAYVYEPPMILGMSPEPEVNTRSHGVWAGVNPDTNPDWTDTGGGVSSQGIGGLIFDSAHGVLYAATSGTRTFEDPQSSPTGAGVWRYSSE